MKINWITSVAAKIHATLKGFPYLPKRLIFLIDLLMVTLAFSISYWICYDLLHVKIAIDVFLFKLALCLSVTGFFFFIFKTYSGILRYSSFMDALRIFAALFLANTVLIGINKLLSIYYSHSILSWEGFFINFELAFSMIFFSRMVVKLLFDFARTSYSKKQESIPLLIYGTKPSNVGLAKLMINDEHLPYRIVGFISQDWDVANKHLINQPVYYRDTLFKDLSSVNAKAILINPEELERSEKQMIADKCLQYKIDLLSAPSIEAWKGNRQELKKVRIEDLLGRIPIQIDLESIEKNLNGKTVLITGAAGSIGSEIVRQVCRFEVGVLLICDIAESPLHELSLEIKDKFPMIRFVPIVGNVTNYDQMKLMFECYKPHYIYHAAAYKHVPLMEAHPCEAVMTNVLGSRNIVDLALFYHAEAFVMISTDKAVNPTNVMGASKRIAEIYVQSLSKYKTNDASCTTRIITTRFGNVLGSNGSVIPRFENQIKQGGPVTVTHPDIIRYFMTIPEACRLVLEAGNFGKGGEVFIFDMGESVKIKDLAEKMVRLSGLQPYKDIEIKFTGLRPGEKLHEELLYDKENVKPTHNRKIKIGSVREYDYQQVVVQLDQLIETARTCDKIEVVRLMKQIVPEYISQNSEYEKLDHK
ncbi:MAG: polysaccharide biosynthesis protein [Dysgonamonadaceae bacterium]|nr:polysaccharide biosynthesis protein [Dysgonamonadaceae bacterium]